MKTYSRPTGGISFALLALSLSAAQSLFAVQAQASNYANTCVRVGLGNFDWNAYNPQSGPYGLYSHYAYGQLTNSTGNTNAWNCSNSYWSYDIGQATECSTYPAFLIVAQAAQNDVGFNQEICRQATPTSVVPVQAACNTGNSGGTSEAMVSSWTINCATVLNTTTTPTSTGAKGITSSITGTQATTSYSAASGQTGATVGGVTLTSSSTKIDGRTPTLTAASNGNCADGTVRVRLKNMGYSCEGAANYIAGQ